MNKIEGKRGVIGWIFGIVVFAVIIVFGVVFWPEIQARFNSKTEEKPQEEKKEEDMKPEYARMAKTKLKEMSLEEKVGQMLFSRVPENGETEEISKYNFGGYILFGRDVQGLSLDDIGKKVQRWQDASKIPMLVGIDEEGGLVSRLSYAGLADFRSPQELYEAGGMELIRKDTKEKVGILAKIGVNVNFAPVADTCETPGAFIYDRSFGKNATETSEFVKASVQAYRGSGVTPTLKHFPGYGDNTDTHTGIAIDNRSLESFRNNDFLPFLAGIQAGADFVMISHNIITEVDSTQPASISPEIHRILRNELGFDGIILTDDLAMDAISEYYHGEYPAEVQAVLAGNTMLVISDYARGYENVLNYVKNGVITEKKIDEAVLKILEFKYKNGVISAEKA